MSKRMSDEEFAKLDAYFTGVRDYVRAMEELTRARDSEAAKAKLLHWVAQTVHQAHHDDPNNDGQPFQGCTKATCRAVAAELEGS